MNPIIGWVLKLVGLAIVATGAFIAHKKYKVPADNFVEELVEKEIKDETGLSIDLSPDTPDPDNVTDKK